MRCARKMLDEPSGAVGEAVLKTQAENGAEKLWKHLEKNQPLRAGSG